MIIGVPKEIKEQEFRVALLPSAAYQLVQRGHQVLVERNAGAGAGFPDAEYARAGATILEDHAAVFSRAELIVQVQEPQPSEYPLLRPGQILFTYLHLAADLPQTEGLLQSGCVAIAYETVTDGHGRLPLLAPMSEVAGRMSVQVGEDLQERMQGGPGILIGGVPGVHAAKVVVVGGGVSGTNAIRVAMGMEAQCYVLDKSIDRLSELDLQFGPMLNTIYSTVDAIEHHVATADLVIGAVLVPGAVAPKLITREMLRQMRPASVFVDIAIDQGGCAETSRPTGHDHPTFVEEGVTHYCVTNMPAAVPRTSTFALNNATLPFVLALAAKGWRKAAQDDPHLANGVNVVQRKLTSEAVARSLDLTYTPLRQLLS